MPPLGPLVVQPIFKERIWGAESLPPLYPQPAAGTRIGEIWLTAGECTLSGGSLPGSTLAEASEGHPDVLAATDGFPLLLKLLLPREKLSVQVHPNDEQAAELGETRGKTECWYVLEAEPGAEVAVGLRESFSPQQIAEAIQAGTLESKLRMIPVHAGDMVFVDAGTIHAIGPGMTVLETQQYSDITYRLYDYGRPRELHVEQGLAVARTQTRAGLVTARAVDGFERLVQCEYFAVDRFDLHPEESKPLGMADTLQIVFALGEGAAVFGAGVEMAIPQGRAVLLPAENVDYSVRASGELTLMRISAGGSRASLEKGD